MCVDDVSFVARDAAWSFEGVAVCDLKKAHSGGFQEEL